MAPPTKRKKNVKLLGVHWKIPTDDSPDIIIVGRSNFSQSNKQPHSMQDLVDIVKRVTGCYFLKQNFAAVYDDPELRAYGQRIHTFDDTVPARIDWKNRAIYQNTWVRRKIQNDLFAQNPFDRVSIDMLLLHPQRWRGNYRENIRLHFSADKGNITAQGERDNFNNYIRRWSHAEKEEKAERNRRLFARTNEFYQQSLELNRETDEKSKE